MKQNLLILVTITLTLLVFPAISLADSPITSTDFYNAYLDNDMVQKASKNPALTQEIADYLNSKDSSLDVKAAIINALGWDFNGKDNASKYCTYTFNKPFDRLDLDSLTGEQLFCIGYLKAMDDYFHPEKALPILEKSQLKLDKSFTVAIVTAIVKSQIALDTNWANVWKYPKEVLENDKLTREMNDDAIKIITDYLALYKPDYENNNNNSSSDYIKIYDDSTNKLNSSIVLYLSSNHALVNGKKIDIDSTNSKVFPIVKNGSTLVPLRFILESIGADINLNSSTSDITIEYGKSKMIMNPKSNYATTNNKKYKLALPPQVIKGRVFVPLRAVSELLNKNVLFDKGLIIISSKENVLDPTKDAEVLKSAATELKSDI